MKPLFWSFAAAAVVLVATGCPQEDCIHPFTGENFCAPDYYDLDLRIQTAPPATAPAGSTVTVSALVVSNFSNQPHLPVEDVNVQFQFSSGGGPVTTVDVATDDNGIATVPAWTLSLVPGVNLVKILILDFAVGQTPIKDVSNSPLVYEVEGLPRTPTGFTAKDGNGQTGAVASTLTRPLQVELLDGTTPVAGVSVSFSVTQGNGSVATATTLSDGAGLASTVWTLGTVAGAQRVTASAAGRSVIFDATALAGAPNRMVKVAQTDSFTTAPGTAVPTPPRIRIVDQFGNGVGNVTVGFTATAGSTVGVASAPTDPTGHADPGSWTLGPANTYQVTAVASGPAIIDNGITFTGFAVPPHGPPVAITKVAGDNQTQTVATVVTTLPAVRVTDAQGRPVPGVTITFNVGTGSGAVTGSQPVTDGNGVATLGGWTLGNTSGVQYLLVSPPSASGITPTQVVFQLNATPDVPAAMIKFIGDNRVAIPGATLSGTGAPTVKVVDRFGNGVNGIQIVFTTPTAGSAVTGGVQTTINVGLATVGGWTLSPTAGPNQLIATASLPTGLVITGNPLTFTATGTFSTGAPEPVGKSGSRSP